MYTVVKLCQGVWGCVVRASNYQEKRERTGAGRETGKQLRLWLQNEAAGSNTTKKKRGDWQPLALRWLFQLNTVQAPRLKRIDFAAVNQWKYGADWQPAIKRWNATSNENVKHWYETLHAFWCSLRLAPDLSTNSTVWWIRIGYIWSVISALTDDRLMQGFLTGDLCIGQKSGDKTCSLNKYWLPAAPVDWIDTWMME